MAFFRKVVGLAVTDDADAVCWKTQLTTEMLHAAVVDFRASTVHTLSLELFCGLRIYSLLLVICCGLYGTEDDKNGVRG